MRCALAVVALAVACFAQQQEWEQSIRAARQLVESGRYIAAVEKLTEAFKAAEAFGLTVGLNNLAGTLCGLRRYAEAEGLFEEALALAEKGLGTEHPVTGLLLNNLGRLHLHLKQYPEAEQLLARSLVITEHALGTEHPYLALTAQDYAQALRKLHRKREAAEYKKRAQAIQWSQSVPPPETPWTAGVY